MKMKTRTGLRLLAVLLAGVAASASAGESAKAPLARQIVEKSGVRKGIGLDLGPGDAELAMEVARLTELTIHCVEPDPGKAAALREKVDAAGLYGRVVVDEGSLQKLPYPDYCANLIICGDELAGGKGSRDFKELLRVLNPNGAAMVGGRAVARGQLEGWLKEAGIAGHEIVAENGAWALVRRPPNPGWDEWTHPSHDPGNSFGSADATIRTADLHMHWACEPVLGLSGATILMAGGRQFLECREFPGTPASAFPAVYCHDAFNGLLLWKREGKAALPFDRSTRHYPPARPRLDCAATEDRLYILGGKVCHVLDAATGETLASWPVPPGSGAGAEDIWLFVACVGEALYGAAGPSPGIDNLRRGPNRLQFENGKYNNEKGTATGLFALDRRSGKPLWARPAAAHAVSLAVGEGKVFFCGPGGKLSALDAASGKPVWENAAAGFPPTSRMEGSACYKGKLWALYHPGTYKDQNFVNRQVRVFSAADGKFLFSPAFEWGRKPDHGSRALSYLSLAGDMAFVSGAHISTVNGALDLETGRRITDKLQLGDGAHKCTPRILTPHCLFLRGETEPAVLVHTGPEAGKKRVYQGFRPTCWYPPLPAYGLVYVTAGGCNCSFGFRSNVAMIPGKTPFPPPGNQSPLTIPDGSLVKGPAFGGPPAMPGAAGAKGRWATWRGDAKHSGMSAGKGGPPGGMLWSREFPAGLTPAAVADGAILVGSADGRFYALDAASGKPRWQYFASGRIQTAPYAWEGRVYFGDEDGWVHCLRAADGKLAWKFRAAPAEDRVVAYGGLMSRWPVGCGVVVDEAEGIVYFLAGAFPTDAKAAYALDARTGAVKWATVSGDSRYSPRGVLALGKRRLYFTTQGGRPREIGLDDAKHGLRPIGGDWRFGPPRTNVKQLSVVGEDGVIAGSPGFGFVYQYYFYDQGTVLPVVTDDVVYGRSLLTLTGGKVSYLDRRRPVDLTGALRAEKRAALPPLANQFFSASGRGDDPVAPDQKTCLWEAWKGNLMTALIKTGGTIYSGSKGKVFATGAEDGKELWSAEVPGEPLDLAWSDGRLVVVCDSGAVVCFGR